MAASDHRQRELRHPAPPAATPGRPAAGSGGGGSRSFRTRPPSTRIAEATRSELYRHLERALRKLPPDQRTAVVLCDVYGMDYNEVAAMTHSALGTVKSRIHRGRLRLRELLAGTGNSSQLRASGREAC
jgi:RNA polymerase sigma factor (sigma-70 family)